MNEFIQDAKARSTEPLRDYVRHMIAAQFEAAVYYGIILPEDDINDAVVKILNA